MSNNPLKQYFRQPNVYVKLPTQGRWYNDQTVSFNSEGEVAVYPLSALDDILLNTPDAMLNGQALEKVVKNCVPDVHNIKKLLIPDLEAIFVGIKSATNNGKAEYSKECPGCKFENTYDLNCNSLLSQITFVDANDCVLNFNSELEIHIRPYDFSMRQLFIKKEFDEERLLRNIDDKNKDLDELSKARILGESVDRLSSMTFQMVSNSIEKIILLKENMEVTDREHINEWLISISKTEADTVIEGVNKLNNCGVSKELPVTCSNCSVQWTETLSFDPSSFFGKRS